jgi:hypothetical protein
MKASSLTTNLVPSDTPWAPSHSARATPAPSPMPPEASAGSSPKAATVAGSSFHMEVVPRT